MTTPSTDDPADNAPASDPGRDNPASDDGPTSSVASSSVASSSSPAIPHRFELTIEVPGTPEQVWAAIATANGISSWMMPTDLEEREGGAVVFHMGDTDSAGHVTGWDPPRRLEYAEPDWADLAGHGGADVEPIVTEFLVEAKSGGTCVVRVVSSAFGTGADWEQEFFEGMAKGWTPCFDVLRLYLTHFPGQTVTTLEASTTQAGPVDSIFAAMCRTLGVDGVGQAIETRGGPGVVELLGDEHVLVRLTGPVSGFLAFRVHGTGDEETLAAMNGYLFSADAPVRAQKEQPAWQEWLENLSVTA